MKKRNGLFLCIFAFLSMGLIACSDDGTDTIDVKVNYSVAIEQALTRNDFTALDAEKQVKWGERLNDFSLEIEKEALKPKENGVISAYSLHSALSMTAAGAGGQTLKEMADVLDLDDDIAKAAAQNGAMRSQLRFDGQSKDAIFRIANRIWADIDLELEQSFSDILKNDYLAEPQIVDFSYNPKDIVKLINQYVANNTDDMIKKLVDDDFIKDNTKLVLVNAIFFHAKWKNLFENHDGKIIFHGIDGQNSELAEIHQTNPIKTAVIDDLKSTAVRLDYEGEKFHLLLIMADNDKAFLDLRDKLKAETISDIQQKLEAKNIKLRLPLIKIESTYDAIIDVLKKLGIKDAFSALANFSGISKSTDLYISDIVHKAVIEWDEKGTKAAAATAIAASETSIPIEPEILSIDKPFRFMIIHNSSNAILFSGQYVK